jgi:hypothetical protein
MRGTRAILRQADVGKRELSWSDIGGTEFSTRQSDPHWKKILLAPQ